VLQQIATATKMCTEGNLHFGLSLKDSNKFEGLEKNRPQRGALSKTAKNWASE
jgi:hypothetical protein